VGKEVVSVDAIGGFEELREIWAVKPHATDQAADRAAFEEVCRHASVDAILVGARAWAAAAVAAEEERFMQPLAKWLADRCWEKPPPARSKQRGNGKYTKPDLAKEMLKQELGYEEDDDGNLYNPAEGRLQ
jgi:hypothetical protein